MEEEELLSKVRARASAVVWALRSSQTDPSDAAQGEAHELRQSLLRHHSRMQQTAPPRKHIWDVSEEGGVRRTSTPAAASSTCPPAVLLEPGARVDAHRQAAADATMGEAGALFLTEAEILIILLRAFKIIDCPHSLPLEKTRAPTKVTAYN